MLKFNWLRRAKPAVEPVFDPIEFLRAFRADFEIGLTAAGHLAVRRQGHWRSLDARHGELSRWLFAWCAKKNLIGLLDQPLVDRATFLLMCAAPELPRETVVK